MNRSLLALSFIAFVVVVTWRFAPQLAVDLTTPERTWSLALDLRTKDAKCTAYFLAIDSCSIDWMSAEQGNLEHGSVHYLSFGKIAEKAILLRAVDDRSSVTILGAPRKSTNRIITLLAIDGLCLVATAALFFSHRARLAFGDIPPEATETGHTAATDPSPLPPLAMPSAAVVTRTRPATSDAPVFGRRRT